MSAVVTINHKGKFKTQDSTSYKRFINIWHGKQRNKKNCVAGKHRYRGAACTFYFLFT